MRDGSTAKFSLPGCNASNKIWFTTKVTTAKNKTPPAPRRKRQSRRRVQWDGDKGSFRKPGFRGQRCRQRLVKSSQYLCQRCCRDTNSATTL